MKRLLLAASIVALFLPAAQHADARADVSIDFFYTNLGNSGNWVDIGDYGYVWQPSVAVSNSSWRPYADGYWAYTDVGWTWVSYEDFGWATYHYGRWVRLRDRGWFWVPGREWGPAWVSWRTGGDYVGWAPLPPRGRREEIVYEGRLVYGAVDIDYDIGPLYYNFIDVRYIGEPVLRERIYESNQNYGYMERTVNVTNITYNNSTVCNYGPDYNVVSTYSTRPIQRLTLQRPATTDYSLAAQSGGFTQVQGDKLVVSAPLKLESAASSAAPKVVKEKIAQPTIERGWSGVNDQAKVAQLKQKMKAEDPKKVPPPDITPKAGAAAAVSQSAPAATSDSPVTSASPAAAASAAPGVGASPVVAASPAATPTTGAAIPERGKGKDKRPATATNAAVSAVPPPSAAPGESIAPVVAPLAAPAKGKGKNKRPDVAVPALSAEPAATAGEAPAPPPTAVKSTGKGKGRNAIPEVVPPSAPTLDRAADAPAVTAPDANPRKGKEKKSRQNEMAPVEGSRVMPAPAAVTQPPETSAIEPPRSKHSGDANREAREAAGGVPPQEPPRGDFSAEGKGRARRMQEAPSPERIMPPTSLPPNVPVAPIERPGKGEKHKKGGEPEATPTPGQ